MKSCRFCYCADRRCDLPPFMGAMLHGLSDGGYHYSLLEQFIVMLRTEFTAYRIARSTCQYHHLTKYRYQD